jgi:hypothetical protein
VQAAFESSHNVAAKAFSLPRWTGSLTTTPIEQLERSLSDHWDRHTAPFVASLAFDTKKWIGPIATFLGIFILLGACAHTWGVAFVLALIAGGIWALAVNNQRQAASKRQAEAREFLARAKHDSTTQLRAARGELTDWHAQFAAADAVEPTLAAFIQALPAQARAPLPYESRGLTGVGATGSGGTYGPPPARDLPTQPGGYDSPASSYPNS